MESVALWLNEVQAAAAERPGQLPSLEDQRPSGIRDWAGAGGVVSQNLPAYRRKSSVESVGPEE